ncbi:MAG: uroporphyrinogen-III synthase [Pseudomonadales bacterium]|nr:uroporphyrinogen-III synthase [Pseudomonadales bacterium]
MTLTDIRELDLSGLSILVTRPLRQQQSLCEKIAAAGGKPLSFPLIEIASLKESNEIDAAKQAVQDLDQFDVLVFVSSNAAKLGADLINDYWPQFPVGVEVIAIGKTTAETITAQLTCQVVCPDQGSDSEAVLALPGLQTVANKRVGIFRGQGGRELLAATLQERGADVQYIEVYRRVPIPHSAAEISAKLRENSCDVITVHSGESLQILVDQSGDNIKQITLLPLVVPSQRVARQAQQLGFEKVECANGADDDAMLNTLQQLSSRADNTR